MFGLAILAVGAIVYKFLDEINSIVMDSAAWLKKFL